MKLLSSSFYLILLLSSCQQSNKNQTSNDYVPIVIDSISQFSIKKRFPNDYWLNIADSTVDEYGYKDQKGNFVIPMGKYIMQFTDTFRTYAIVLDSFAGFVGIDRKENKMYNIFPYDNSPDAPAEGLFRIVKDGKIGYADYETGEVVIPIQYPCAWPFKDGKAKVAVNCKDIDDGEHSRWESEHWFYIDKTGKKLN